MVEIKNTTTFYDTEIPSDWRIVKLGDLAKIKHGRNQKDIQIEKGKYPILASGGEIGRTDTPIYSKPSVLIGRKGTIDKPRFIETPFWTVDTLFYTEIKDEVHPLWLFFKFQTINWYLYNEASGVPSLSASNISTIKIPTPPLHEQRTIAKVLGTIDEAINANNQLIAQKELRKKWLMQNLLTGKKRLKGFSGEWKDLHIRDVSKEVSIRNKDDKQLTVLSCTKYDGLVPSLEYFGRKIYSDDLSTYKIVKKNHFAYATNHIEEGSIGYNDVLDEALISPMYTIFKTDKSVNDIFFFKLLKSHRLIYEYNARMEGSIDRRGGLRWSAFSIIKIKLPSFEEQTAVAQVLQSADKELNLLKAKTDKLKEQKKGMMQLLLTGKKRLKL
jgi:type I restriction enzyme S subunit